MSNVVNLRRVFKSITPIYEVNARLKARRTSWALSELELYYSRVARARRLSYSRSGAVELLRARIESRGIARELAHQRPIRIFWVGANLHQDSSGFLDSLQTFGEVVWFRNRRGEYGLNYAGEDGRIRKYDPKVVETNDLCLLEQVSSAFPGTTPDLLLGQMWANYLSSAALKEVQELGIITANISMDDRLPEHWRWHDGIRLGSVGLCGGLDLVLTTSPECCVRYMVEGCPALFWPPASDPNIFRPFPEIEKEHDVVFIGSNYGIRTKIVGALRRAGIRVDSFGPGWPNGPVGARRLAEIFGKSRIILGVGTIAHTDNIYTLKLRDFDATMAGALYITHRNPDLLTLFEEGKDLECYVSIDECLGKVRYYLNHPEKRITIAMAAANRARREHTWESRFDSLFAALGFSIQR